MMAVCAGPREEGTELGRDRGRLRRAGRGPQEGARERRGAAAGGGRSTWERPGSPRSSARCTGDSRARRGCRVLGVGVERVHRGSPRGRPRHRGDHPGHRKAMKDAERMAGVEVGSVYTAAWPGEHVAGRTSPGVVSVTGSEIRTADVARVNDVASNVSFGHDQELLHAIPQDYLVDQQPGISDPIGMIGSRLEAEVYLVTVLTSAPLNLRKCVGEGRLSRRRVRPGAARRRRWRCSRPTSGSWAGDGRAGRRLHHRGDLPGRQDPAHRLAPVRRRARHQRHRPRPAGDPARRPSGSRRPTVAPTSVWWPSHEMIQLPATPGQGAADRQPQGAGSHHAHAAAGDPGARARRDHPGGLPPAAAVRGGAHRRRGPDAGDRGAGPRSLRACRSGWACRVRDWRGLVDGVESPRSRCRPGWRCMARQLALRWRASGQAGARSPAVENGCSARSNGGYRTSSESPTGARIPHMIFEIEEHGAQNARMKVVGVGGGGGNAVNRMIEEQPGRGRVHLGQHRLPRRWSTPSPTSRCRSARS